MSLQDYLTIIPKLIGEGTTPTFGGKLLDEAKQPVLGSQLESMTLTLTDSVTGEIINDCEERDILGANGGAVDELGNWELKLKAADTAITTEALKTEVHLGLIEWSRGLDDAGKHLIVMTIANLAQV